MAGRRGSVGSLAPPAVPTNPSPSLCLSERWSPGPSICGTKPLHAIGDINQGSVIVPAVREINESFAKSLNQNGLKRLGNHVHFYNECYSKRNAAQGHLKPYYDSMYVRLSPKANEAPLHQSSGRPASAQRRQAREQAGRPLLSCDHEAP